MTNKTKMTINKIEKNGYRIVYLSPTSWECYEFSKEDNAYLFYKKFFSKADLLDYFKTIINY